METVTRTVHTHAMQVEITPEFAESSAVDWQTIFKREALYDIQRTNPDAEVIEQKLVRGVGAELERQFRDPNYDRQIWCCRTRFSTALPVVYPEN